MGEFGPKPEMQKPSVLTGDFADITNPAVYIEKAGDAVNALKKIFNSVEK